MRTALGDEFPDKLSPLMASKIQPTRILVLVATEFGFSPVEIEAICESLAEGNEFKEECGPHLFALIQELHRGVWFSMEFLQGVLAARTGVLAGTPLADLLFTALMVQLINFFALLIERE